MIRHTKPFAFSVAILLLSIVVTLSSCEQYQEHQIPSHAVLTLNRRLEEARLNKEKWVDSPTAIARHLFPPDSHDGGPKHYQIGNYSTIGGRCSVTVLEEGPIDDEVLGQRHTIELQLTAGRWNILDYRYALKHRK